MSRLLVALLITLLAHGLLWLLVGGPLLSEKPTRVVPPSIPVRLVSVDPVRSSSTRQTPPARASAAAERPSVTPTPTTAPRSTATSTPVRSEPTVTIPTKSVAERAQEILQEREQQRAATAVVQSSQRSGDLERALAQETAALSEDLQAQEAQAMTALLQAAIQGAWSRPPSARNGMQVVLDLQLVPTGEVVAVNIAQSSGSAAFDRSAINAVRKAAPFTVLKEVESTLFNQYFRQMKLIFRPEDLRR